MNKKHYFLFTVKIFHLFNFHHVTPATKFFSVEFSPNYGMLNVDISDCFKLVKNFKTLQHLQVHNESK